jgi:hypothetical protein
MSRFRLNLTAYCFFTAALGCAAQNTSTPAFQDLARKQPAPAKTTFDPVCTMPAYPSPAPSVAPVIDSQCGLQGSAGEEANQNAAKNNFCVSGTPKVMTIQDFTNLQNQVDNDPSIPFGNSSKAGRPAGPATNRAPIQALGEGTLVRINAYVLFARQEGEESVNCGTAVANQSAFHDIHIELVGASNVSDECSGIVAEMIPHHRADSWAADNVEKAAKGNLPVRVTGQLFFDSSHLPCQNGAAIGDNPKRISLWEIHPIYQFEVCSSGTCSSGTGWVPLDQWVASDTRKRSGKSPSHNSR